MSNHARRIPASIEASPKHVVSGKLEPGMLPSGTSVFITDVGVDPLDDFISANRLVGEFGYHAVPHLPVRRIESLGTLERRLGRLRDEAGATDTLVIAGEADRTMGPFEQSTDVLHTALLDRTGFTHVAVAGHPEGNTAYRDVDADGVLSAKSELAQTSDAEFRIVTQFGFDGAAFARWADAVAANGIDLPIHLGAAGPAKITTLLKFAAMCGVGASLGFLKKRSLSLVNLATSYDPEEVVRPIETAWAMEERANIAGIHIFPFGGLKSSAEWLYERGSFTDARRAVA